jgi:hypothetical protein
MVLCPISDSLYYDDDKNPVNEYFECPGLEDPPDHNRCCDDKCCPTVTLDSVLQVRIYDPNLRTYLTTQICFNMK